MQLVSDRDWNIDVEGHMATQTGVESFAVVRCVEALPVHPCILFYARRIQLPL